MEIFEEFAVAFEHTPNRNCAIRIEFIQRLPSACPPMFRRVQTDPVAMRALLIVDSEFS